VRRWLPGLVALALWLQAAPVAAQSVEQTAAAGEGRRVEAVRVVGLTRTRVWVVERELSFGAGDTLTREALGASVRRLRNLRLFAEVEPHVTEGEAGGVVVELALVEKWTLLPIVRFGGGGGVSYLVLGLYDRNSFGTGVELGGQYDRLAGVSAGSVWVRHPHVFGTPLMVGQDLETSARLRTVVDRAGAPEGVFILRRSVAETILEWTFDDAHLLALHLFAEHDAADDGALTSAQRAMNTASGFGAPSGGALGRAMLRGTWGRLDYDNFRIRGARLVVDYQVALGLTAHGLDHQRGQAEVQAYATLPLDVVVGTRLGLGVTDARQLSEAFFVGGLENVRGLADGRFHGRGFWQVSAEGRLPWVKASWLTVQQTVFVDAGDANAPSALINASEVPGVSAGTGLLLTSPRLARAGFRLEYARALLPDADNGVAFGARAFYDLL